MRKCRFHLASFYFTIFCFAQLTISHLLAVNPSIRFKNLQSYGVCNLFEAWFATKAQETSHVHKMNLKKQGKTRQMDVKRLSSETCL